MKEISLTPKQKAFADYYITLGNATEAYMKAYVCKKESTARTNASRLLTNANVIEYIKNKMKHLESERIATAEEVMKFLTSVMRGEIKDQFELDASLQDRLKATDMLAKRFGLYTKDVDSELKGKSRKVLQVKVVKNDR
ncbi:MAG: terminase small subunit [Cetobacterium sp.]